MSGGGEHLKDEVRSGTNNVCLLIRSRCLPLGLKAPSGSGRISGWASFKVKAFMPAQLLKLREGQKRFFIAPLDVLKIRLQLQIHTLSDPSSQASASAAGHLLRRGTIQTFKRILHDEGVTVNFPPPKCHKHYPPPPASYNKKKFRSRHSGKVTSPPNSFM